MGQIRNSEYEIDTRWWYEIIDFLRYDNKDVLIMQQNGIILKRFMLKYEGVGCHHVRSLEMILQKVKLTPYTQGWG